MGSGRSPRNAASPSGRLWPAAPGVSSDGPGQAVDGVQARRVRIP